MGARAPEHVAVDDQRILVGEELGEGYRPIAAFEAVFFLHLAARRQRPALSRHALDMAAQFDLFGQQCIAGAAIRLALIGEAGAVLRRKHGGGYQMSIIHDDILFLFCQTRGSRRWNSSTS